MRIRSFLSAAVLFSSLGVQAQGIKFEEGDWASVRAKAQKANRLVYVDVYTTWCGPCKILAKQIFPQKEAGDKFNSLFVNYRIDAEKGEGIALAKKYDVNGYPTHLFIDPKSEAIVYRGMGTPANAAEFNKEADIAVEEKADPMTLAKYQTAYAKGKKDSAFLVAYMKKAERLEQDNDKMIDDYVAILKKRQIQDADILFLFERVRTVDNDAVPLLYARRDFIDSKYPENENYFNSMVTRWAYATFEKAVKQKNDGLLDKVDHALKTYTKNPDPAQPYWFRTQYYEKLGDKDRALASARAEADFLSSLPDSYFREGDARELENAKRAIRSQLKMMNIPEAQIEPLVDTNLKRNPSYRYQTTFGTANKLNNNAWQVYEQHAKDAAAVQQALVWAQKAMDLSKDLNEWSSFADTKAHLLYVSGKRSEAILQEQKALQKARALNSPGVTEMEEELKKMETGKL